MSKPKCPNHDVDLILTNTPGVGICPISNCRFEYEEVKDEETDKPEEEIVIMGGQYVKQKKLKFVITKGSEDGHDWKVR